MNATLMIILILIAVTLFYLGVTDEKTLKDYCQLMSLILAAITSGVIFLIIIDAPVNFGITDSMVKNVTDTLSPEDFMERVSDCASSGGTPIPIYDKDNPTKIYTVECE